MNKVNDQKTVLILPKHGASMNYLMNKKIEEFNKDGWVLENCIRMSAYDMQTNAEPKVWNQWEEYLLIFNRPIDWELKIMCSFGVLNDDYCTTHRSNNIRSVCDQA